MLNIVLVEPEIPQNAGNVARTCVLTNSRLHLIRPMGFSLDDRQLKRAGLDYWKWLEYYIHDSWNDFLAKYTSESFYYFSIKGSKLYTDIIYEENGFLIFGSETRGLSPGLLQDKKNVFRLPMAAKVERSLNLANTAAVVVYEALRQQGFPRMV